MWVTKFVFLAVVAASSLAAVIPDEAEIAALEERNNFVAFILYNNETNGVRTTADVAPEGFQITSPTVVLVHGQGGGPQDTFSRDVRQAYSDYANEGWNVIVMDWAFLASGTYAAVVENVSRAANDLVRFLETLKIEKEGDNSDVHLIGFGIGAHVAGNAGNQLRNLAPIARITGLAPVGRNFGGNSPRLSADHADYVEVVHTDGGLLGSGIDTPIGDVDFFMNGGSNQPGCSSGTCNQNRSFEFFVASLYRNHLIGNRCNSMSQVNWNTCSGPAMSMGGEELVKSPMLPGLYRANTGRNFPF